MATKGKATEKAVDMSDVMTVDESNRKINMKDASAGVVRIDDGALINVKSNVFGALIFIDPITKEKFVWIQCGDVLQLPFSTLRHMKNGAAKFFVNQLVIITGFADENAEKYNPADIYKALYITQYYTNILDPTNYEEICGWDVQTIKQRVKLLTDGAKGKLIVALNTYIEKGILDSLRAIKAFEDALGCDLQRPE